MGDVIEVALYRPLRWVNCEACGGSGEIIRRHASLFGDPPDEYSELCEACGGTGRDCADFRDETVN